MEMDTLPEKKNTCRFNTYTRQAVSLLIARNQTCVIKRLRVMCAVFAVYVDFYFIV